MKTTFKTLLICLLCVCSHSLHAQTLHAIIFGNTNDKKIGESVVVDLENTSNQIQTICRLLDYDLDMVVYDGPKCTRANLKKFIDEMFIEQDDIVFTYYSGHGSHAMNDAGDPWPQYLMNTSFENQSNWVPMALLDRWVSEKNPRLRVVVSDCCNKEQYGTTIKPRWAEGGRSTVLNKWNANFIKQLFSGRGSVLVTSSKLGQVSFGDNSVGGYYTCDFWDSVEMAGNGGISPNWENVLKKAYDMCSARKMTIKDYPYTAVQNPYYRINLNGTNQTSTNNGVAPTPTPINNQKPSLMKELSFLTDKSISVDTRLHKIPEIINKYFDAGAKAVTVGNDMKTMFDYEDVKDFLRRICLSNDIKGVNIIQESRNLIKVHEVR